MRNRVFKSYTRYAFSEGELKRLLAACDDMGDYIMILLASRYGMRREDVVNIKVNDINFASGMLSYYERKKKRILTVPLEADVAQDLKRYIGTFHKGREYLLPFQDGSTAWRHLQDLCKVASIAKPEGRNGRPFHSLRGTAVKQRQAAGWTIHECAALIGDEADTVSKHYATVTTMELAEKMKGRSQ